MEDYYLKYSSFKEKFEPEDLLYSGDKFIEILKEELDKSLEDAPQQIYGNWKEQQTLCKKISRLYSDPKEVPFVIIPDQSSLPNGIEVFARRHHTEFLWLLEKEVFLSSGIRPESNLSTNEKLMKDKALSALRRDDRTKAFNFFKEAVSRFPDDFTLYGDIAFLYLNDKCDTRSAMINIENACRMLFKKKNPIYCFLKLALNTIHHIEGDLLNSYSTTKHLLGNFGYKSEVNYQHAINALNIKKKDEGLYHLKKAFKNNINYTLRAYEEIKDTEYKDELNDIFFELTQRKEAEFSTLKEQIDEAVNKAELLGIESWGKDILPSLKPDLDIISTLACSKIFLNIAAAEYFIVKTPELIISKAKESLLEAGKCELEKNNKTIVLKEKELNDEIETRKKYNMFGLYLLTFTSTVCFGFLSIYASILVAFSFSIISASILLISIGLNTFKLNKTKFDIDAEIKRILNESKVIAQIYREEANAFEDKVRDSADIYVISDN